MKKGKILIILMLLCIFIAAGYKIVAAENDWEVQMA